MTINQTPASNSDARKRKAESEASSGGQFGRFVDPYEKADAGEPTVVPSETVTVPRDALKWALDTLGQADLLPVHAGGVLHSDDLRDAIASPPALQDVLDANTSVRPEDAPPVLPDTSSWVRREPGDVIEAGTPFVVAFSDRLTVSEPRILPFSVSAEVTRTYWTPPPAPKATLCDCAAGRDADEQRPLSEPWSVISTDREKPTLARVTADFGDYGWTMVGEWWRTSDAFYAAPNGYMAGLKHVTHVELLHTHNPESHVPVERALIERLTYAAGLGLIEGLKSLGWSDAANALAALASLASDESSASDGGRS